MYSITDMRFFLNFVLNTYRAKVFFLGGKQHHFHQNDCGRETHKNIYFSPTETIFVNYISKQEEKIPNTTT